MKPNRYDFVVIGGGVAGTVAAIAAARMSLKTLLIQNRPVLGGPSSSECSANSDGRCVNGAPEYNRAGMETGIVDEMRRESFYRTAHGWQQHWSLVMREFAEREKHLTLMLNTEAFDVKTANNRIVSLRTRTLGSEKEFLITAPLFADCTGDASVGFEAGAKFRIGRESREEFGEANAPEHADKKTMGSSISFRAEDMGHAVEFHAPSWAYKIRGDEDLPYRMHGNPRRGYWWLEYGGEYDTIGDNEQIYQKLLAILYGVWDHVKNGGDHGAENFAIDWVSAVPAKRESRRLMGDVIVTQNDVVNHTKWDDAVAFGGWTLDVHPPEGVFSKGHPGAEPPFVFPGIYTLPFRALYSKNIRNLMMAGRDISVTHIALGTTRLMATCGLCGHAIGYAAKLCAKHHCEPREVGKKHIKELQKLLYFGDSALPGGESMEKKVFSKVATSSEMTLKLTTPDGEMPLVPPDTDDWKMDPCCVPPADRRRGQMFPVTTNRVDSVKLRFNNDSGKAKIVSAELYESVTPGEFEGKLIAKAEAKISTGKDVSGEFKFNAKVNATSCFVLLSLTDKVAVLTQKRHLPGLYCKHDTRYFDNTNWCLEVTPTQRPFAAATMIDTPPRPWLSANCWISDPECGLPQSLELTCAKPIKRGGVEVIFDTNLDVKNPNGAAPECAKDFKIEVRDELGWHVVGEVAGNYQRRCEIRFSPRKVLGCRLTITATNGDASARCYQVRLTR